MRMFRLLLLTVIILWTAHLSFGSTILSYGTWSIGGTTSSDVNVTVVKRFVEVSSHVCPSLGSCVESGYSSYGNPVGAYSSLGTSQAYAYAWPTDPIVGWDSYYTQATSATPAGTQTSGYGSGYFEDTIAFQSNDGLAFDVDLTATIPLLSLWGEGEPSYGAAGFGRALKAYDSNGAQLAYFDLSGYFDLGGPLNVGFSQWNTGWTTDVAGDFSTAIGANTAHNSFLTQQFIFPSISLHVPEGSGLTVYTSGYSTSSSYSEPAAAVPEPGTLMLLGTGLIGAAGLIRRKIAG